MSDAKALEITILLASGWMIVEADGTIYILMTRNWRARRTEFKIDHACDIRLTV